LLNVLQSLPIMTSFAAVQANRLLFARASFYNVGLFAAAGAMTVPLVIAALAARRAVALPRWATNLLLVVLAAGLAGLFFSLSKSAWIATAGGTVLLLMLLVASWRRRLAAQREPGLPHDDGGAGWREQIRLLESSHARRPRIFG
jgi:hypothetical protein